MAIAEARDGGELQGGILFEPVHDGGRPGLVSARFAFIYDGLPVVPPGRVLIDREAYYSDQISYPDSVRARHGLLTAAKASDAQLWEMDAHVAFLDGRFWLRSPPGPLTASISGKFYQYHAAAEWGPEGLRAALRAVAVEQTGSMLADEAPPETRKFACKLLDHVIARGPFLALSALNRAR